MRNATAAVATGLAVLAMSVGPAAAQGSQAAKGQAPAQAQLPVKDRVAVRFNGLDVRTGAIQQLIQAQGEESRRQLKENPEALPNLLRNEALRKVILAKARQEGFEAKPEMGIRIKVCTRIVQ